MPSTDAISLMAHVALENPTVESSLYSCFKKGLMRLQCGPTQIDSMPWNKDSIHWFIPFKCYTHNEMRQPLLFLLVFSLTHFPAFSNQPKVTRASHILQSSDHGVRVVEFYHFLRWIDYHKNIDDTIVNTISCFSILSPSLVLQNRFNHYFNFFFSLLVCSLVNKAI